MEKLPLKIIITVTEKQYKDGSNLHFQIIDKNH